MSDFPDTQGQPNHYFEHDSNPSIGQALQRNQGVQLREKIAIRFSISGAVIWRPPKELGTGIAAIVHVGDSASELCGIVG